MTQEMLSQYTGKAHSHVGDTVSNYAKELILQVSLEEFLLIHSLAAHKYKDLSSLESSRFEEVLSNSGNYSL